MSDNVYSNYLKLTDIVENDGQKPSKLKKILEAVKVLEKNTSIETESLSEKAKETTNGLLNKYINLANKVNLKKKNINEECNIINKDAKDFQAKYNQKLETLQNLKLLNELLTDEVSKLSNFCRNAENSFRNLKDIQQLEKEKTNEFEQYYKEIKENNYPAFKNDIKLKQKILEKGTTLKIDKDSKNNSLLFEVFGGLNLKNGIKTCKIDFKVDKGNFKINSMDPIFPPAKYEEEINKTDPTNLGFFISELILEEYFKYLNVKK